jgi:hypothetical protein
MGKDIGEYCGKVFEKFFRPGEVTEIRAFGLDGRRKGVWEGFAGGGIVYGYFDNADDFGRAAEALDKAKAEGVYFVLNPVDSALLARSCNRLKGFDRKMKLTSDKEVKCLRWLLVDLDPARPAGISSSEEELAKAKGLQAEIRAWLVDSCHFEGPKIVATMSGNGCHVLCRLPDWPNEQGYVDTLKSILDAIDEQFGGRDVDIDQVTFNPSRLCKVYGTVARKGDDIEARPHRWSYLDEWKAEGGGAGS